MKSGLEDRNNAEHVHRIGVSIDVSMKSGLEDRNNSIFGTYFETDKQSQ